MCTTFSLEELYQEAEASLEFREIRKQKGYEPPFHSEELDVLFKRRNGIGTHQATIKIRVSGEGEPPYDASEGVGSVDAMKEALIKALRDTFPMLASWRLTGFETKVLEPEKSTASEIAVFMKATDGNEEWTTVGISGDILEASWEALVDSIEYLILKDK